MPVLFRSIILAAVWAGGLLAVASGHAIAQHDAAGLPSIEIELAPVAAPDGRTIETLDVRLRFEGLAIAAGDPVARLPLVASNVDTVATVLSGLTVTDAAGPLPLDVRDADLPEESARDALSGGRSREWLAGRAVEGGFLVEYTVPADATLPPRGPAPPFSFTNDGGGMSAAGHVFLLLPAHDGHYRATVDWDLARAPQGSRGVSSLGEGRVDAAEPMSGAELRMAFYMAGDIVTWPDPVPASGFFGAVQGTPPFDGPALLAWAGELHDHYAGFFGQEDTPSYGIFMRYNPVNAGGGVGLHRSFVITFGEADGAADVTGLKSTLAHEMFHTFQPFIETPGGLESSWFGEGLATFYQSRLPLRFGLIAPEDFLEDLNFHAGRYYSSIMATAPNSAVPERFWADTRIRTLPYDRGMLYFATVDHALRIRSGGTQSLDDLMLGMLRIEQAGETTSNADWEALLREAMGEPAVADFRAFLEGAMPVPASEAFGPCFRRTTHTLRRYELGFDTAVLAEPVRIVRGLVAGSAAEAAGIRNGDEIVRPVPQDHLQGDQEARLTLLIRRDDETFPVTYWPRGEAVEAYQWERVEGVADAACMSR